MGDAILMTDIQLFFSKVVYRTIMTGYYFILSETLCVLNGLYSNDHLIDISEDSLLYGEK